MAPAEKTLADGQEMHNRGLVANCTMSTLTIHQGNATLLVQSSHWRVNSTGGRKYIYKKINSLKAPNSCESVIQRCQWQCYTTHKALASNLGRYKKWNSSIGTDKMVFKCNLIPILRFSSLEINHYGHLPMSFSWNPVTNKSYEKTC